jgi:hypothetical protein
VYGLLRGKLKITLRLPNELAQLFGIGMTAFFA